MCAGIFALALGTAAITASPAHAATTGTSGSVSSSADPRYAALTRAASTGQAVTVDSLTTADSQTQALPNGTLATTTTVLPTRMRGAAGGWENIDPTLKQNSDGSISTTATPNALTLSGGGSGSVVTATDPAGHTLALSLPASLPAPTLNGASATYANIYPGISLTVTAAPTGGFSEVFEVADAAAEARAGSLRFSTHLSGLSMSQSSNGALSVVDSGSGKTVMTAPAAIMWDSATTGAAANNVPDDFEKVTGKGSSTSGPGLGAHTGPLKITDSGSTLSLDGASGQLDTATPTFPLYLDPTWTEPYQSGGTNNYSEVQSGCPTIPNWDDVTQPGVGYNNLNGDGNCPGYGAYRSYFDLATSNLNSSDTVVSSTMKINEVFSSDNSCGEGTETITVKWTDSISSGTTWNTQPAVISTLPNPTQMKTVGNGDGTMCTGGSVPGNFDLTSAISQNAKNNGSHITLGLFGDESGSWESLERYNDNPSVYTVYDIPPNNPDTPTSWPTPVTGISSTGKLGTNTCPSSSTPGYLGIGNIGGSDIATLSTRLTSPIAAAQMNAAFTVHDVTANTTATYTSSGWAASGANVSIQTGSLKNGDEYYWNAKAWDQYYNSAGTSATCYLKVDTTPPSNPSITSSSWPTLASGKTSTVTTGSAGSFSISASDGVSGIAGYYYSFDTRPVPSAGGGYQTGTTIAYTPTAWGAHTLYVQSLDNAGNLSAVNSYSFYVPWNPASTGVTGSVAGDKSPDLITNPSTGSFSGDLVMVPGDSNPDTTPTAISTSAYSPDGTSWANYQVTHDGSYTNHPGFDDLWAFQNSTQNLYLYLNNQSGTPFETASNHNAISKAEIDNDTFNNAYNAAQGDAHACVTTSTTPSCSGYDYSDWSQLTQILAPGDLYAGDPNTTAASGAVDNGAPGLLTVENGTLWYYQGQDDANYLNIAEQLGSTGWDGTTLIGTTTTGSGSSTKTYLLARINTGTSAGAIMQYPISFDPAGNLDNLGTPTGGSGTQITLPDAANNNAGTTSNLPAAAYPQLYAWDMHSTGHSDLIATTPSGTIIDWPGATPNGSGTAQFTTPESLAAATSTSAISLASNATDFPSGTTWDDGTATLGFNQGQLTVTLDATGQVVTQYGAASPGAYLTLQTDGNLVIYASNGTSLWSLHKIGVSVASGDNLTLSGSALTLKSSSGATLWTAASSVPVTPGAIGEAAFTTSDGDLAITIGAGAVYTQDAIATGSSPAVADLGGNSYEAAFQGTNGDLETYSNSGTVTDTGHAMAAGTSPAIAAYAGGGWAIAFQGSNMNMQTYTSTGTFEDSAQGMEAGTSPAIAASPSGGYKVAMEVNTTAMYTDALSSLTSTGGTVTNTQLGMTKGTNPAITALSTGGYEVAFQANTGSLWLWGDGTDGGDKQLGMLSGTSPAIAALANGEWQAAFQANTGILWTVGNAPGSDTGYAMAAGTNPAIAGTGGETYAVAWQGSNNNLTTMAYDGAPANTGHAMSAGTSPTLVP